MNWIKRWFVMTTMGEMLESIQELTAFAEAMPSLQELVADSGCGQVVEYDCEDGFCVGFYLYRRDGPKGYAAQRSVISGGATLPCHVHDETEVLVLCYGKLSILMDRADAPFELEAPGVTVFGVGQPHTVTALETSWGVGNGYLYRWVWLHLAFSLQR